MIQPLIEKVAFITGGSKGIGRAICIGLARAGAAVAMTGRDAGDGLGTAANTAAEITAAKRQALALTCDMRDREAVRAAIDIVVATYGRLDILIKTPGCSFLAAT